MDNIFDLNSISVDFDLMERANPVFNTAKMTLFQLSASGNEYAAAIAEKLGLTYDNAQNSKSTKVSRRSLYSVTLFSKPVTRLWLRLQRKAAAPQRLICPADILPAR